MRSNFILPGDLSVKRPHIPRKHSDFAYLLGTLKKQGKKTIVVGFPVVTSRSLRESADEYVNVEDLLAAGAARITKSARSSSVIATSEIDTFYFKKGIHFESYVTVRTFFFLQRDR